MKECLEYISWLKVPKGVETEVVGIAESESMAAGYNVAMHGSDAKYKVYLHQDLYILNENFINDVIDLFTKYPQYGMLGVLGSKYMIRNASYWKGWNIGKCDANNAVKQVAIEVENNDEISEVEAIDGMIMITQYDVEWREDIFDGFDFYDVSQSEEFRKHGYKIGVPYQKTSWCNHLCGSSKLMKYDEYRKMFCAAYENCGYCFEPDEEIDEERNGNFEIEKTLPLLEKLYENKQFGEMNQAIQEVLEVFQHNTRLCELAIINQIIQMEFKDKIQNGFYDATISCDEMIEKYHDFRFLLLRIEYGKNIDSMQDILKEMMGCDLRSVIQIAEHSVFDVNGVVKNLIEIAGKQFEVKK